MVGAVLFSAALLAQIAPHVEPEHFYHPALQAVYQAILDCDLEGHPVDSITVWEALKRSGSEGKLIAQDPPGQAYLIELSTAFMGLPESFGGGSLAHHAQVIREKAEARRLIERMQALIIAGYQDVPVATLREHAQDAVFQTSQLGQPRRRLREVADETVDRLEILGRLPVGTLSGVSTGYHALNALTGGLQAGDLIIDAARPAMGKTAFALNVAENAAQLGHPCLIFSIEMSNGQLAQRAMARASGVGMSAMREGLRGDALRAVRTNLSRVDLPIELVDWSAPSLAKIRAEARAWRLWWSNHACRQGTPVPLGLVVVDYLSLIEGTGGPRRREQTREREVAEVSRGLKALAKELGCPVLALAQVNRQLEARPLNDRRPRLSDLRESGAVEQDADVVIFLYRHHVYDRTANPEAAEAIVAKHRNGPLGVCPLRFRSELTLFENP